MLILSPFVETLIDIALSVYVVVGMALLVLRPASRVESVPPVEPPASAPPSLGSGLHPSDEPVLLHDGGGVHFVQLSATYTGSRDFPIYTIRRSIAILDGEQVTLQYFGDSLQGIGDQFAFSFADMERLITAYQRYKAQYPAFPEPAVLPDWEHALPVEDDDDNGLAPASPAVPVSSPRLAVPLDDEF